MTVETKVTPMLQQYLEIKAQHENTILFYRMGDFYEMFFDDAIEAAKILSITLTSRNKKTDPVQIPMCGVPYHAAQTYLAKLIRAGKRVAICEQVEDPAEAKGIVRREVIRVVSPGVVTDDQLLDDKSNNYVCSIALGGEKKNPIYGISFLDVSTGEFLCGEFPAEEKYQDELLDQISRFSPAEILFNSADDEKYQKIIKRITLLLPQICITTRASDFFHLETTTSLLRDHFKVISLDGYGLAQYSAGLIAAGVLLDYIRETQKSSIDHIAKLSPLETQQVLQLDEASRRNLELTQTIAGGQRAGSLIDVLDQTCTPMGARLLKHNLLFPLQDPDRINNRLDSVTYFFKNSAKRKELRALLENVYDIERLNSRIILGSANGRDLLAMKQSLLNLPEIIHLLIDCDTKQLIDLRDRFDSLADICKLLEISIFEEAPVSIREGNLIKTGYNPELDELNAILRDGKQLILNLETQEREATGIAKLKIGFNKVFGYFIEISKANAEKVPDYYIRKQTLVNAERFITPELKEFENKVLGAEDRRIELEYQLFTEIRQQVAVHSSRILNTAKLLAQLDFFASSADISYRYKYRRPEINCSDEILIREGRHPVIERSLPSGQFVPNDIELDQTSNEVLIITGPNMGGKSTILRQTALIVLMSQMGCYVPAESASIGIVDRIFTRVGAMDNLRYGQSTFMVEMSETANILNNATDRSLVILDEIGRGTSTYDGLSIAWAVTEELVKKNDRGVKTLFATHYHELTELSQKYTRIQNFSVAVREWQNSIIFLHKLIKGGASRSYGIQVAGLAGVPQHVVKRASEILKEIERGHLHEQTDDKKLVSRKRLRKHPDQLSLFAPPPDPVFKILEEINIDTCSPIEALNILHSLKKHVAEE